MKIVVTGASGFLGGRLAQCLRARGTETMLVSRRSMLGTQRVANYGETPAGDILVHLAQENDRAHAEAEGEAGLARALADLTALIAKPYVRIVYVSSAVLYGDAVCVPRRVTEKVTASGIYGRIKLESERLVLASGRGVVARLANLYGPGMSGTNVLSTILSQIPGVGPVRVMDDAPVRDFLWADDAAAALHAMITGDGKGIYNVGTGIGTSVAELARLALAVAGQPERPVMATHRSARVSCLFLDIDATIETWNWRPTVALCEGLSRLMKAGK